MFLITGGTFLVFIPFLRLTMPERVNESDEVLMELTQNQESHDEDFNSEVTYYTIFSDPLMIALLIAQVILSIACNYYCPVLSFRLLDFTDSQ